MAGWLKAADAEGDLPVHRGLESRGVAEEVLIRMTEMYPDGCKKKNRRGDLPLHDAILSGKSTTVVEALATVYPDAITIKDREGLDPIHCVLDKYKQRYNKAQQAHIVMLFIRLNVKAASAHDREEGLCPLHLIVQDRGFDMYQVTEQILASHPECASFKCKEMNYQSISPFSVLLHCLFWPH